MGYFTHFCYFCIPGRFLSKSFSILHTGHIVRAAPPPHPGHGSVRIGLVPRYVSPITALSAFIQVLSSGYTFQAEARTLLMSGFFLMQLGTKDIFCFHLQETGGECTRLSEHKSTGKETSTERHSTVSTNTLSPHIL